ncbi:MAG: nucleotidyltransferase domain-containing protein [Cyanobacteria bacterium]|nr:nucleotidyltransferase domain-containing protein [Cyanobacteriota bacterium]MDA0866660.1 nucleotidyltransferase domain-containing protein [Cyanobacteriota bacterium]
MQHSKLDIILKRVKQDLTELYPKNLESIVLYGSQARQDSHEGSDIDILVVLNAAVNPYKEIDKTSQIISKICLDYDVLISRHFISSDKFGSGQTPFLKNIRDEGVAL